MVSLLDWCAPSFGRSPHRPSRAWDRVWPWCRGAVSLVARLQPRSPTYTNIWKCRKSATGEDAGQGRGSAVAAPTVEAGGEERAGSPTKADQDGVAAKKWWDTEATSNFQHLDESFVMSQYADWRETFLTRFVWQGKRVVDYGIGGGFLGKVLLEQFGIASYTGIDISEKALDMARSTLRTFSGRANFLLAGPHFYESRPDLFVCQQVIQHFPSIAYFETFLANVDACGAQDVMLHFRQSKDGKTVAGGAYANSADAVQDVSLALLATVAFISERLLHYELIWTVRRKV